MKPLGILIYKVIYSYRLEKKFPEERWKKLYKWHCNSHFVICKHHQVEIHWLLQNYLETTHKEGNYEIKIIDVEKVDNNDEEEDGLYSH
jgi:hypothetical protein